MFAVDISMALSSSDQLRRSTMTLEVSTMIFESPKMIDDGKDDGGLINRGNIALSPGGIDVEAAQLRLVIT